MVDKTETKHHETLDLESDPNMGTDDTDNHYLLRKAFLGPKRFIGGLEISEEGTVPYQREGV